MHQGDNKDMTKYKVYISIDGENFFWVIIENGNVINRNVSREELAKITTKVYYYNKTNICPICIEENNITDKSILYPGNTCHEEGKNGNETDKWICIYHRRQKIISKHKIYVSFDEKNFFWIVVENGKIINRNPTDKDLIGIKVKSYSTTNICPMCRKEYERYGKELTDKSILYPRNALHEIDKEENKTKNYICHRHGYNSYQRYDHNSQWNLLKKLGDRRTRNQDPNSNNAKGDKSQKLVCRLYGWKDLNEENDNYSIGTPIDCYDPKTDLYHQVQGRYHNPIERYWPFSNLENEWRKIYEDIVCICISKDGKIVERIYIIPFENEIKAKRTGISIYENPTNAHGNPIISIFEQYRRTDEDELKRANEIWKHILEEEENTRKSKRKVIYDIQSYGEYIVTVE